MLGQRLDRNQRLERLGALPAVGELVGMHLRPLPDEPKRARWQGAVDHAPRPELDLRDVLALLARKCGGGWSGRYIQITIP